MSSSPPSATPPEVCPASAPTTDARGSAEGESLREEPRAPGRRLLALLGAVTLVYALVVPSGFLSYDDPWLVVNNPVLDDPSPRALAWIWTVFDPSTRFALGAEYLPVRDTLSWLLVRLVGKDATAFHLAQLATYLAAVALVRAWLTRVVAHRATAEGAAWLFALHPAHVSSVAWIAGWKDALALLFVAAALVVHSRPPPGRAQEALRRALVVAALVALGCLSKGVAVIAPVWLLLSDFLAGRRVVWAGVVASSVVVGASLAVQVYVGGIVAMFAAPLGGGLLGAIASMAPVAFRYLGVSFLLDPPCIVRLVPPRGVLDPVALAALLGLVGCTAAALAAWRLRGARIPVAALGLFAAGLAPVSQVFAPLQNRMADRYLLFAVLGPCLLVAAAVTRLRPPLARLGGCAALLAAALSSALHVWEFADERRLWESATERVPASTLAPYQLGLLELGQGDLPRAEAHLRMTLARDGLRTTTSSHAITNLSRILVNTGRSEEAIPLLRAAVARFPAEPRPINNLATLLHARGDHAEARALFDRLVRRFPTYARGRDAYVARYGALPAGVVVPTPSSRYRSEGP